MKGSCGVWIKDSLAAILLTFWVIIIAESPTGQKVLIVSPISSHTLYHYCSCLYIAIRLSCFMLTTQEPL